MINLTREEAQQVLDALINAKGYIFYNVLDDKGNRYDAAADILRAKLSEPEPEREQCDMPCIEDDGCPTEKAVLQRFWRKHRQLEPEPVAWKVWTVHNHIFFSIGVQTFQINDVLEHEPEVSAKEFSEWLATQLRHALTQLSNTAPPQREYPENFIDALKFHTAMQELEPEPVAWVSEDTSDQTLHGRKRRIWWENEDGIGFPIYTAPPQRKEWVGLTDEEIMSLLPGAVRLPPGWVETVRAIEAKLREKNT
jgi:hypothetical protein